MNNSYKNKTKKIKLSKKSLTLLVLTFLWMSFILWNASRTGEESRVISDAITENIKESIETTNKVPNVFEGTNAINSESPENSESKEQVSVNAYMIKIFVRKSAHLLAYTALAFLSALTVYSIKKGKDTAFLSSLWFSIFIALIDELIQNFTRGRSGKISDVFIDGCGCVMGSFFAICVVIFIYEFIQMKNLSKIEEKCKKISEND